MTANSGCRRVELFDEVEGDPLPVILVYPTASPERPSQLGPYTVSLSVDAPIASDRFPLVVISHGGGGTPLVYRNLAAHLARNGYIVVLPEHPRNNRDNNELGGTAIILANRPRQISHVIDWALKSDSIAASVDSEAVAMIGHSLGGYTALAIAGGRPTAFPDETADHRPQLVSVTPDPRVKALVLLAPATPWFIADGALIGVRVPIFMLTAEHDQMTPSWQRQTVIKGVSSRLEHRVVPNAGHFSFLTPFPDAMTNPGFPPSQDPPGFDRARFHEEMNSEILAFLKREVESN